MARPVQTRHWCFTLNNPDGALDVDLQARYDTGDITYVTWQLEIGESGTVHYQGYLELARSQRLSYVRALLPSAHWESRKGTRDQARDYARKSDSRVEGPHEIGEWVPGGSGRRTDIHDYASAIRSGASRLALFEQHPRCFLAYQRGTDAAIDLYEPKRTEPTAIWLFLGPPGCGKTRLAMELAPNAFFKQLTSKWWDGYYRHEDVIFDDFYGSIPYHELLRLGDRTPLSIEIKGGQRQFVAKRLLITSNKAPIDWYREEVKAKYDFRALMRRITKVYYWDIDSKLTVFDSYEDFEARPPEFRPSRVLPGMEEDF